MGAKADAPCGALNGQQSEDLASYRDEYRDLRWDTRGGHDRAGDPAAAAGQLLPAIAAGTVGPARAGLDLGCGGVVPAAETLALPVREGGRIVLVGGLIATGVCAGGSNSLGLMSPARRTAQDGGRFFLSLVARGLSGVAMVTSDAHAGLVAAIATAGPPVLKLWRVSIGGNWSSVTTSSLWTSSPTEVPVSGSDSRPCAAGQGVRRLPDAENGQAG